MDNTGWRAATYHRLHWLWPLLFGRVAKPIWHFCGWLALVLLVAFAGVITYLRFELMPRAEEYQGQIEAAVSEALGLNVRFGTMQAYWSGINPGFLLKDLSIHDRQGQAGLSLREVRTELSWRSLWHQEPTLSLLTVESPVLSIRRDPEGKITIAGLSIEGETDPRMRDWILRQTHVRILNATVEWHDQRRQAPSLHLDNLDFGLDNRGDTHRFGLSATPPQALASRLDLRGELEGASLNDLERWSGKLFSQMDYVDLAAWTPWLDYPVALPRGKGGLRLWLDLTDGNFGLVADAALDNVRLRLNRKLPELDLIKLRGRFEASRNKEEWRVAGRQLALETRDGVDIPPSTFEVEWQQDKDQHLQGKANANRIDIGALARLATHLPLDERSRKLLQDYGPQGLLADLRGTWESQDQTVARYTLKGRFEDLGLKPVGHFPGAGGISGDVDASEKGGVLRLNSKKASLELPLIFAEPRLNFDDLQAKTRWSLYKEHLEVRLESLQFANSDAAGVAQGIYRYNGQGPGHIDLTANLQRGQAASVWRYMPLVVNADARHWVKQALVSGAATEAKLELRGDLTDFPFRDPAQGKFLVAIKAKDVKLDYANGWPQLENISGDVRFQGPGMVVEAKQGKILGAATNATRVEVADFDTHDPILSIKGKASGPTQEFLKFIDKSPVGDMIDRFTEGMSAMGNGALDLELSLPLARLHESRVKGEYQLGPGSKVFVVEGLPPVTEASGRIGFTESSLHAKDMKGNLFGAPLRLQAMTDGEKVNVNMSGGFHVAEARKSVNWPFLDALSGSTAWKGEVRVRKKSTELVIQSNLVGISSSLPLPFNKTATTALPLQIVKGALPLSGGVAREQIAVTLGKLLDAKLIRRHQDHGYTLERGTIGINDSPRMPSRGLAASVVLPEVDLDAWQQWAGSAAAGGSAGPASLPAGSVFALRTLLLSTQGRRFDDVNLQLRPEANGWQIGISAKQALGDLHWSATGKGALRADLKRLHLNTSGEASDNPGQLINDLPSLDFKVADFAINEKRFGRLEALALNEAGSWRIDRLALENPDGRMSAKGMWKNQGGFNRTQLEFDLDSPNVGGLLDRLGFPGAIKRGAAKLRGQISWQGSPTRLDYASLSGEMKVEASKGQFAKVEPGIGKLLGLISLQSLPRRITLDFRDVFSDGFAFDNIESRLLVRDGIMRTAEDLLIEGPAARVVMKGEADLKHETQNLTVTVQPELGGAAAMGVALAHPVVGVATLLASKVLQNPLNKLFAFQYKVTGTWDDPKVDKLGVSQPNPGTADSKGESK